MPRPGQNGAAPGKFTGKTLVLTGTFPEAGGGAGLELGKAKVKACVESFGGRVTSGVSRKTDILIVGEYRIVSKTSSRELAPSHHSPLTATDYLVCLILSRQRTGLFESQQSARDTKCTAHGPEAGRLMCARLKCSPPRRALADICRCSVSLFAHPDAFHHAFIDHSR